jgi:hypothetical protein
VHIQCIWKIYDCKIEVVPFIINFSTELTTVVKFEVYVQKWYGRSCICGLFNFQLWRICGQLSTKIYDKRNDFNFKIINFPNMCSNIPVFPAYGVYISQLIRYARASSNYSDTCYWTRAMSKTLLRHTLTKYIFDFAVDLLIFIHFHFMKIHRSPLSLQRQNIFWQCLGIEI